MSTTRTQWPMRDLAVGESANIKTARFGRPRKIRNYVHCYAVASNKRFSTKTSEGAVTVTRLS